MIKKIFIATFFGVFALFSIFVMRGRLLYLDAVAITGDTSIEARLFHLLYLVLLILYVFFTYLFFKADPEDDGYRKILMGMASPIYVLGIMGLLAGIGCGVLGCVYGATYDPILGALINLEFLDRFFGDEAKVLYKFAFKVPYL
jgi:hypothetical protein|tara:strand:+ start:33272 stop:33703 length:432 start_codon:yes stop_codon:yes gene_type:complete